MVLVTTNKRMWAVGLVVSVALFALVYITVIKPSSDTANQAVKSGMQQSEQVLKQAEQQLSSVSVPASTSPARVVVPASQPSVAAAANVADSHGEHQAAQLIGASAKLASCVSAAGTNEAQLQVCQSQFGH
jgi:hypothetical protein